MPARKINMARRLLIGMKRHFEFIYLLFLGCVATCIITYHYMRGTLTHWLDSKIDAE